MGLKRKLVRLAASIENSFDDVAFAIRRRLWNDEPLQIIAFRTYGSDQVLYVKGRVLADKGLKKSEATDTIWANIVSMYQRFGSDEVRDARLRLRFGSREFFTTTNDEGYFVFRMPAGEISPEDMWQEVIVELVDAPLPFKEGLHAIAEVLVPPVDAEYGIISDIDDTIVKTTATSLLAMSKNTFFHNAHTRLPFAGVSAFYKALQLGRNGKRNNPFFYVSSSPWNLYDLLIDFLDLNNIPPGPLLLRDFGLENDAKTTGHMGHKFSEITQIMDTYPALNFVLIGDSGQEDPKIYREVVRRFPGRVIAIYIRDVALPERERIAVEVSQTLIADKVEMIIVDNTVEAAEHAARTGLIFTGTIPSVEEEKKLDKGEVAGKEDASLSDTSS